MDLQDRIDLEMIADSILADNIGLGQTWMPGARAQFTSEYGNLDGILSWSAYGRGVVVQDLETGFTVEATEYSFPIYDEMVDLADRARAAISEAQCLLHDYAEADNDDVLLRLANRMEDDRPADLDAVEDAEWDALDKLLADLVVARSWIIAQIVNETEHQEFARCLSLNYRGYLAARNAWINHQWVGELLNEMRAQSVLDISLNRKKV